MASNSEYEQRQFWETTETEHEIVRQVLKLREENKDVLKRSFNDVMIFGTSKVHYDKETGKLT